MNVRFGKCASCGAEYKVPDSFQHDMARCKECGGVTHFGPAQPPDQAPKFPAAGQTPAAPSPGATPKPAPAPMPARKVAPKPTPPKAAAQPTPTPKPKPAPVVPPRSERAPQPAAAKRPTQSAPKSPAPKAPTPKRSTSEQAGASGGSMLERLKAQRAAEAQGEAPASPPARSNARTKAAKGAPSATAKAGRTPASGGRTRPAAGRRGSTRKRKQDEDETEDTGRGRRGARTAKKSPLPALLGIGGLLLAGGAAFFFLQGDDEVTPDGEVAAAKDEATPEPTPVDAEPEGGEAETDAGTDTEAAAVGTVADAFAGVDPADDEQQAKAKTKKIKLAMQDPAAVDLSVYEFGPAFDTTSEEWDEMNGWMAEWMDPFAGAAGSRARGKLVAMDIKAIPVIINAMTELDLGSEEGRANGDIAQRELTALFGQKNYGWAYPDRAAEDPALDANRIHVYNKKVVKNYATKWQNVLDQGIEYFITFTELDEKDGARARELRKLYGSSVSTNADGLDAPPPLAEEDVFDVD
ncbi:MAG: hypothetical protein WD226_14565 [Planctomycetota bacterium]